MAKKLIFQQPCTDFLEMTFILSHMTGDVCISLNWMHHAGNYS